MPTKGHDEKKRSKSKDDKNKIASNGEIRSDKKFGRSRAKLDENGTADTGNNSEIKVKVKNDGVNEKERKEKRQARTVVDKNAESKRSGKSNDKRRIAANDNMLTKTSHNEFKMPNEISAKNTPKIDDTAEYSYEEDFEDYADDFDDPIEEEEATTSFDPAAVGKLSSDAKAGIVEQQPSTRNIATTAKVVVEEEQYTKKTVQDVQPPRAGTAGRFNFSAAAARGELQLAAASRLRLRQRHLTNLVQLDFVNRSLFEMQPATDYDLYMLSFGTSNKIQALIQTGDDSVEQSFQTEEIEHTNKWTQIPPFDRLGCGGDSEVNADVVVNEEAYYAFDNEVFNYNRFKKFFKSTSKIIIDCLQENVAVEGELWSSKSQLEISENYVRLVMDDFCKINKVNAVVFCEASPSVLLVAVSVDGSTFKDLETLSGLVFLWDFSNAEQLKAVLICEGEPKCICFGPGAVSSAFAGLHDGSIVAWDLTESSTELKQLQLTGYSLPIIPATFTTACFHGTHASEVVAIKLIGAGSSDSGFGTQKFAHSLCQLASVDSQSCLVIWSVLTAKFMYEEEIGARPGARLQLQKVDRISADKISRFENEFVSAIPVAWRAHTFSSSFLNPNHFYIGGDMGQLVHCVRYHSARGLCSYRPPLDAPADTLAVHCSPFAATILLCGSSDGAVRLYKTDLSSPILILWYQELIGQSVIALQWSFASPFQFFSLYSSGALAHWDLAQTKSKPVALMKTPGYNVMSVCSKHLMQESTAPSSNAHDFIAFANESGVVEVHLLKNRSKVAFNLNDGGTQLLNLLNTFL